MPARIVPQRKILWLAAPAIQVCRKKCGRVMQTYWPFQRYNRRLDLGVFALHAKPTGLFEPGTLRGELYLLRLEFVRPQYLGGAPRIFAAGRRNLRSIFIVLPASTGPAHGALGYLYGSMSLFAWLLGITYLGLE